MCLLFLFLIAASVGLVPIMVYRSLGVPLPNRLKGYRNVYALLPSSFRVDRLLTVLTGIPRQPWMIGPAYSSPSSEGVDVQTPLSTPSQDPETTTNLQTTATPKVQS